MNQPDRPKPPQYRVTLTFRADGTPAIVRLRRFLKMALRAYGLRAVKVEELPGGDFRKDTFSEVPDTPAQP